MFKHLKTHNFILKNTQLNQRIIIDSKKKFISYPKRYQSNMNNPLSYLPPVTRGIIMANCAIYGIGLFMSNRQYITEFFYNHLALKHHKYHVLITAHIAKANFFDFFIETLLTGFIGSSLEPMLTSPVFLRLVMSSAILGSILMVTMHKEPTFFKSEAIFRGMIMFFVFKSPFQHFYLFPLPIKIQAFWLGIFIVFLDFITGRWANFGGTISAFLLLKGLL
jgi:membrane associated rhomboid family serine protease